MTIDWVFWLDALLSGSTFIIGCMLLVCITMYLRTELHDRRLGVRDWLHFRLPSHINFAVAVAVYDFGICVRAGANWAWRRWFDSGAMPVWLFVLLITGGTFIVLGGLCKIRWLSYPFMIPYTRIKVRPWRVTLSAIIAFMAASIYFR